MTAVTTNSTLEPVKRVLRTVIAVVVAVATATPWIIQTVQGQLDPTTGLSTILIQVTAVSTGITAFAASPAGQWLFGLVGLDATAVQKINTDVAKTETDVTPAIGPVVAAVKDPSVPSVIDAASAVVAVGPTVGADAQQVGADVATVGYGQESDSNVSNGGTV